MKSIMKIYDSCSIAIRITFFGFLLVAFGFLIQNDSVNIFYTFKNTFLLFFAEGSLKLGTTIIANLPMIFMLNICCKKANSGYPVILAIIGYFSYLIATMLFAPSNLSSYAYSNGLGINSIFNIQNGTRLPLETGLFASFIVAYITRISYIRSRYRTSYSVLGFLNKDSAGIIYNIVFCTLAGIAVAYGYPYLYNYTQTLISYIAKDLMDPLRIAIYGIMDRGLSILSLNNIIRQPFWYTALGGSYKTTAGLAIVGDVNIWSYIKNASASYVGAGRFITPYYVINMFMVPTMYFSIYLLITDKQEKRKLHIPVIAASGLSLICGSPLPLELFLLFTSPILLVFYLIIVGAAFYFCSYFNVYLGLSIISGSIVSAMPGNFPDFIINIRNLNYTKTLGMICLIGLAASVLCFIACNIYYRFLAFDFANTGKTKKIANEIIDACGGVENIDNSGSGLLRLCIHLKNLEAVNIDSLKELEARKISETKDGIDIECGTSAYILSKYINKQLIR